MGFLVCPLVSCLTLTSPVVTFLVFVGESCPGQCMYQEPFDARAGGRTRSHAWHLVLYHLLKEQPERVTVVFSEKGGEVEISTGIGGLKAPLFSITLLIQASSHFKCLARSSGTSRLPLRYAMYFTPPDWQRRNLDSLSKTPCTHTSSSVARL